MLKTDVYKAYLPLDKHFLITVTRGKFLMKNYLYLDNVSYFLDVTSGSILRLEKVYFIH